MPTVMLDPISLPVIESSHVGDARRTAVSLASSLGYDETACGEVALIATELATNLARHAKGGEIVLRSHGDVGVELLAIDRGPGMANFADSLRDGHSTAGTSGTGLGAVSRLATTFDVHTARPTGTVVLARHHPRAAADRPSTPALPLGVVSLPLKGEPANGDSWTQVTTPVGRVRVLVADGLGHGLQAADASRLAVRLFKESPDLDPAQAVEALHRGLRSTRGAAIAVADLPAAGNGVLNYAGVGNISGTIISDGERDRSLVSHNGTAGVEARRIQAFAYPWQAGNLLVMHSDGLTSHWRLQTYPGVRLRHPSVIAGLLYRDHRRERDDVTVLVVGGVQEGP